MEENEMLEQTNDTENVDTQATEEFGEGIELTDTSEAEEVNTTSTDNEKYLLIATVSGCFVNVILNTILIPVAISPSASILETLS